VRQQGDEVTLPERTGRSSISRYQEIAFQCEIVISMDPRPEFGKHSAAATLSRLNCELQEFYQESAQFPVASDVLREVPRTYE
jgi:hypothetical protein